MSLALAEKLSSPFTHKEYLLCVVEEVNLQNVLKTSNELSLALSEKLGSSVTDNGLYSVCVVEDVNLQNVPNRSKSS